MKFSIVLLGLVLLAALVAPAYASHPTRLCIDAGPDHPAPTESDDIVDTLYVRLGTSDSNHPPRQGCFPDQGGPANTEIHIDAEIRGVGDPDESETPESPDMSCTIPPDAQSCEINPPSSDNGDQTIRVWVDNDNTDSTVEADLSEGFDEEAEPGDTSEPDFTDVTLWSWRSEDPCGEGGCQPPVRYETTVTIARDRNGSHFSGYLYSNARRCRNVRSVLVKKVKPGQDRVIRETLSAHGRWTTKKPARLKGRVYAVATEKSFSEGNDAGVVCEPDESPPITVR